MSLCEALGRCLFAPLRLVIHQIVWRRFKCQLEWPINWNFPHKCPSTLWTTSIRVAHGVIHSASHPLRRSILNILIVFPQHFALFYIKHTQITASFILSLIENFFLFSLTSWLYGSSSSCSDLMLNEKLFYGSNTPRRRGEKREGKRASRKEGIDKFLLFTCSFIESKLWREGDEGATVDEGKTEK